MATLQPRPAPKEGIRKLSGAAPRLPAPGEAPAVEPEPPLALTPPERPPSRPSLDPVSADEWSARLTIDRAFKEELETLKCLLSHKIPDGNLAAVLREAVRCGIEKHGKRRGPRCGSRWQLELDHIQPTALGGPSTVENLRLRCRAHNTLHAEETLGRAFMARYRRRAEARTGGGAIASESTPQVAPAAASPSV